MNEAELYSLYDVGRDECELVGGERDGDIYVVSTRSDGLPIEWIQIAQTDDPAYRTYGAPDPEPVTAEIRVDTYRRSHISDVSHRWIYELT